jgi:hypothetical protein
MQGNPTPTVLAFIDGPRSGEREIVSVPPPEIYDSEVLLNQFEGYPLAPGEPDVESRWQMHRYRLSALSWYGQNDGGVALYKHVGPLADIR